MRVLRLRFAVLTGSVLFLLWFLHMWLFSWSHSDELQLIEEEYQEVEQACRHPDLDPYNPLITKHITDLGDLECKRETDWVTLSNSWIIINDDIVKKHGKIECTITYLTRVDDFTSKKDKVVSLTSDTGKIKLEQDFFSIKCVSNDKVTWKNIMAGIHRNENAVKRALALSPPKDSMNLNILIFGLDSMSRLHYIRKLPKTYKYLTEVLNATILKGYNIVGDGTPQALIPILTGSTEPELPETRKRIKNANYVNIYPFAWNNFSENGYVTTFGEDGHWVGTFQYRLKGFKEVPTDHYMRSFHIEADKVLKEHPRLCLGSTPRHQVMLHWLRQFYDVYSDVPKFAFCLHSELSHNDYNLVGYADRDIESFLKNLHQDGILNNTVLMLMSDHGHRFASIRETQQGKQEERLPFFAIAVPPWLERKYPTAVQNLRINGNRLTTPFDIHATLLTVLNPKVPKMGDVTIRSNSLFSEIPQERTCSNADIEPHWCACLSWANVSPYDPVAKEAAQAVIDFINDYTESQKSLCVRLVVDKVTRAEKLQPNEALLKFKKNADKDGFVGEFSDNTQILEIIYAIQFHASPNSAIYEASVKYDVTRKLFHIREHELSRVNVYGSQPHCIHDTHPHLRKHIIDLGDLDCKREIDWVIFSKNWIIINDDIVKKHGKIECTITYLTRVDDFYSKKDKDLTSDTGKIKLEQDFFSIECVSNDQLSWKNIMAGIQRNETAVKRALALSPPKDSMNLNILIFALDSTSRLHYIRKMPKTYKYLTEVLNATVLKGYNIVGDGTPQALIPILTGSTEPELPETRKRMKNANYVNIYPFAWKNFSANGYVTAFGEDCPYTGIFTYRLKGFNEIPTDHYMRSFYVEVDKVLRDHPKFCLGNTPRHQVMLHWLRQFYDVYNDVPKFAFCFHGELSHDDYNLVGYADRDIESFFRNLHDDGILKNTLLIVMSDHGHRFASIRETQQGKQEERLPFFAIVVPPWLERKYPTAVQNLRINANRLTTPFDIHATLLTVLNPKVPKMGDVTIRSNSLFSEIPKERTCSNADIEPHWCACLSWANVSPDDPVAKEAAQAVIDFINDYTESQKSLCVRLVVDKVTRAEKLQPTKALLKFKKNADKDGFVGDFTDDTQISEIIYQVQLHAFPSNAIYEASVKYDVTRKLFHIREHELSRVNMYGSQPHCIHKTHPHLRKYCYCKIQL